MKRFLYQTLGALFIFLTLSQCNPNGILETLKVHTNDPFKNTITPSQYFEISGNADNVVEGENGTIIVCPKGCFKNSKGEVVQDNIKLELAEVFSLDEMLFSNLTTTSYGKPLETDGMIYFNATSNGEQLTISKDNPIHIEIPTNDKKPGMLAYQGIRDENGNMNWINPKKLDSFLTPMDINLLDFLPDGFQAEVEKGMPFRSYKIATKSLTDSLYYTLSKGGDFMVDELIEVNINEPYYNSNKVVKGKYTKESYQVKPKKDATSDSDSSSYRSACGIDPSKIKAIKSEKFQHTLIATKEFETRLKTIFKTCNNSVLEVYIKNLDKNLYQLDSMAAEILKGTQYQKDFDNFYLQKLTNVKSAPKSAQLLSKYYEKQLIKLKSELEEAKEEIVKQSEKKNKKVGKTVKAYNKLLWKREKHRMETYGFSWTNTGWINIDIGPDPKEWESNSLEITVDNGKQFDQVYTYVVYTSIKSLYRLNSDDKQVFYVGNDGNKEMLMPTKKPAVGIAIGYKDGNLSLAVKEFETVTQQQLTLSLQPSTKEKLEEALKPYHKYSKENKISKDLEYMLIFAAEEQRQKKLQEEAEFLESLRKVAFPCCNDEIDGEALFNLNCKPCHSTGDKLVVGPGLIKATEKYSMKWLIRWTRNSQSLIKSGDKEAIKIYQEYNQTAQPPFNLTDREIKAIYSYIDRLRAI